MKRCPQCNRVETDEALKFCRVDGVTLVSDSSAFSSEAGTAQFGTAPSASELHTSILPHNTNAANHSTVSTTALPSADSTATTRQLFQSGQRKILIASIASVLVIVIAVAGYFIAGKSISSRKDRRIESVAVLPFENRSGNADSEYLSDGLAESLIYRLSRLSNLKVSPRSSAFRYKGQSIDAE